MIDASFDAARSRKAAIGGVYQYDTGQRLRLHGLPDPQTLAVRDDFLTESDTLPVVQAHFGHEGDSQAEMRLAVWQEAHGAWVVDVPDEYLTEAEPVHVYIYVYHGEIAGDEEAGVENETRARTMYEGVFTPIARPAPANVATTTQWETWLEMKAEIAGAIDAVQAQSGNALGVLEETNASALAAAQPTQDAIDAAQEAQQARGSLIKAGAAWENAVISVTRLNAQSSASAAVAHSDGVKTISLGVPRGAAGSRGETGDTGPCDVTLALDTTTGGLTITTNE